jgi:hypothetical protein
VTSRSRCHQGSLIPDGGERIRTLVQLRYRSGDVDCDGLLTDGEQHGSSGESSYGVGPDDFRGYMLKIPETSMLLEQRKEIDVDLRLLEEDETVGMGELFVTVCRHRFTFVFLAFAKSALGHGVSLFLSRPVFRLNGNFRCQCHVISPAACAEGRVRTQIDCEQRAVSSQPSPYRNRWNRATRRHSQSDQLVTVHQGPHAYTGDGENTSDPRIVVGPFGPCLWGLERTNLMMRRKLLRCLMSECLVL